MFYIHFHHSSGYHGTALSSLTRAPIDCDERNEKRRASGAPTIGAELEVDPTHIKQINMGRTCSAQICEWPSAILPQFGLRDCAPY